MVEVPPEAFGRASLTAVDSRDAAGHEAGDIAAAVAAGAAGGRRRDRDRQPSTPTGPLTRDPAAITIFKSVGLPIQDLATADLAVAAWREREAPAGPSGR